MSGWSPLFPFSGKSSLSIFRGCASDQTLEVLAEESGIGEIELIGELRGGDIAVAKRYFGFGDECAVNPLFCTNLADLTDKRTEVTVSDTEPVSIEMKLMLLGIMPIDQFDEGIEESFCSGVWFGERFGASDILINDVADQCRCLSLNGVMVIIGLTGQQMQGADHLFDDGKLRDIELKYGIADAAELGIRKPIVHDVTHIVIFQ